MAFGLILNSVPAMETLKDNKAKFELAYEINGKEGTLALKR